MALRFPKDERAHRADYEWWYAHGYLTNESGHNYAFIFSFFVFDRDVVSRFFPQLKGYPAKKIYQLHLGLTDITSQTHHLDELTYIPWLGRTGVGRRKLNVSYGQNSFRRVGKGKYQLKAKHHGRELILHFADQKGPVSHGTGGAIKVKGRGVTYNYSQPRLTVEGSLTDQAGEQQFVHGSAWIDRQWGDFKTKQPFTYWTWMGIQLDDNSELMLFEFFDEKGASTAVKSTYVSTRGKAKSVKATVKPLHSWHSQKTQITYPIDYEVSVPKEKLKLHVQADMHNQEMQTMMMTYWEGACSVSGTKNGKTLRGRAFLEHTGFDRQTKQAAKRRLPR